MDLVKYTTAHLVCHLVKDNVGNKHYQIFESDNMSKPICIYVDRSTMHLADELPHDMDNYKFLNELVEVIQFLYELN